MYQLRNSVNFPLMFAKIPEKGETAFTQLCYCHPGRNNNNFLFPAVTFALFRNHSGFFEYQSLVSQLNRHLIPITPVLTDYSKKQYHSKIVQTNR